MTDKETMAIIKQMVADGQISQEVAEKYFPELKEKESEDEKIRKEIISFLKEGKPYYCPHSVRRQEWAAWLEKQGKKAKYHDICDKCFRQPACQSDCLLQQSEQKPTDKDEPKFKVGDWIINNEYNNVVKVLEINNGEYRLDYCDTVGTINIALIDNDYHLWTIQDAKEGDVLSYVTDEENLWIMIYWSLYEPYDGHVHYHALLVNDNFADKGTCFICIDNLKPATKEQCDLLFQKMKEKGYKWDAEKKELKKIEQKPVWSEEDEIALDDALWCCKQAANIAKDENDMGNVWYAEHWLKSLKDRVQPQPKQEWSEEDINMFGSVLSTLCICSNDPDIPKDVREIHKKEEKWFNELYHRLSPQEWSDEDESIYNAILDTVNKDLGLIVVHRDWFKNIKYRLKSLWKPSEEQMKCLSQVKGTDDHVGYVLCTLYNDLEKLTE